MKFAVLGAGRVGRAMALDLARDSEFEITVIEADLSDQNTVRNVMTELDARGVRFEHKIEETTG